MAISFVGAGAVASVKGVTSISVPIPAGISAGDLLIIFTTSETRQPATPSGWTRIISSAAGRYGNVYTKVSNGTETSQTLTFSSGVMRAVCLAYSGVGDVSPIGTAKTGTSTGPNTNTITTIAPNSYVVSYFMCASTTSSWTAAPAGTTARVTASATADYTGVLIADENQVTPGVTTSRTATLSTSLAWTAIPFAMFEARTLYWVGGDGTWDNSSTTNWSLSSGGTGGEAPPGAADNAIIDTNSGTGTITMGTSATCLDLTITASQAISIGSGTLSIYGSISTPPGGDFSFSNPAGLQINFVATSTGKTVTTNGKTYPNLSFNSASGGWTLASNLSCQSIAVQNGAFIATSRSITCATNADFFLGSGASCNLSSATVTAPSGIYLSGAGGTLTVTSAFFSAINGFIQIQNVTGTNSSHSCRSFSGSSQVANVTLTAQEGSASSFSNSQTTGSLTLNAPTWDGLAEYSIGGTGTINNLSGDGTSFTRRIFAYSATTGTRRNISNGGTRNYVDYRDIGFNSGPVSGTSLGDCGNNNNIIFNAPRILYVVASGTWNSSTTFSLSSTGGSTANLYPLAQDVITFTDDALASGDTTTLLKGNFGAFDASSRTLPLTINYGSFAQNFYRNHTLPSSITLLGTNTRFFASFNASTTVLTIANEVPSSIQFLGSVNFELGADLNLSLGNQLSNSGSGAIFNTNNYNITCGSFSWNATSGLLTLGTSTVTVTNLSGTVFSINTTSPISAASSTLVLSRDSTGNTRTVAAGTSKELGTVVIGGTIANNQVNFSGSTALTIGTLSSTKTVAHKIGFYSGFTTTINNWNVTGTSGNEVSVGAGNGTFESSGVALSVTNRTSGIDYLWFYRVTNITTLINFYAGLNSRLYGQSGGIAVTNPVENTNIVLLTSGTTWTVPDDWNSYSNSNHTVHLFGGGAGGAKSRFSSPNYIVGNGGGGGSYVQAINPLTTTAGSAISYAIGSGGAGGTSTTGTSGGTTSFNSSAFTAGGGGNTGAGGNPGATGDVRYSGGTGGASTQSTVIPTTYTGSAGGGGAGGPNGNGGGGGQARYDGYGFSGGGGNGGGSAGQAGLNTTPFNGTGGNNSFGVGGGTSSSPAFNGGGGGYFDNQGSGSSGIDTAAGMGGGGGGTISSSAGFFGGGGASGFINNQGSLSYANGSAGAQGAIIIVYATGPAVSTSSNFFLVF